MNLLVFRFSAMGDVALTQPVIKHILSKNPDVHITLVTKEQFKPFFAGLPRFTFYGADFKESHKGLTGLLKLRKQLISMASYDHIVDLHDVVRTWVLCFLFSLKGIPYKRIDKGRGDKKKLTRKENKKFKPLKHTTQRYLEVFTKLGLTFGDLEIPSLEAPAPSSDHWRKIPKLTHFPPKTNTWIGVAPFAKHVQKQWPWEKMQDLIQQMTEQKKFVVLLFGGGREEIARLKTVAEGNSQVINLAGKLTLEEEIEVMARLDVMITMDSFNMHLAGLLGLRVVSIWGATHPYAGFGPSGENEKFLVQIPHETLPCRPCSVFGNRPCWRGDFACMQQIDPKMVMKKVEQILSG